MTANSTSLGGQSANATQDLARKSSSQTSIALSNLRRNKGAVAGLIIMGLLIIVSAFAPIVSPYDPIKFAIRERLEPPSANHWMGTDHIGRDIMSRIIYGGRLSLVLGVVSVSIGSTVGILMGLIAGFQGGWVDNLIMRIVDVIIAMPSILLALTIAFALGPSLLNLMIAVGIGNSPTFARLIRGTVYSAKQELYVEAARVVGSTNSRIMFRHVLPNVIAPALVLATLSLGTAILTAATLSYLRMGVQPPTPEWGNMVSEGRDLLTVAPWITVWPGMAIMFSVLGVNLLGDGLRDALDPKLRAS